MAFGRDGSELELSIYDLQNKIFREALYSILDKSNDKNIKKIAKNAITQAEDVIKKFDI